MDNHQIAIYTFRIALQNIKITKCTFINYPTVTIILHACEPTTSTLLYKLWKQTLSQFHCTRWFTLACGAVPPERQSPPDKAMRSASVPGYLSLLRCCECLDSQTSGHCVPDPCRISLITKLVDPPVQPDFILLCCGFCFFGDRSGDSDTILQNSAAENRQL